MPAEGREINCGEGDRMNETTAPEPPLVPKQYGGQWIAWNRERTSIIAAGSTLAEVAKAVRAAGEAEPGFEWVPPADRRIIGGGG
jgi:hypothetical protein